MEEVASHWLSSSLFHFDNSVKLEDPPESRPLESQSCSENFNSLMHFIKAKLFLLDSRQAYEQEAFL